MIWIRADANKEIGTGHVMRCLSIAKALEKLGQKVCFLVADENPVPLLSARGQEYLVLHSDYAHMEAECGTLDELFDRTGVSEKDFMLVDSYFVTAEYIRRVKKHLTVAYMDDCGTCGLSVDMLVNYNIYAQLSMYAGEYGTEEMANTQFLLGTAYAPLRDEFTNVSYQVREKATDVLITTGGSDKYNLAGRILEQALDRKETAGLCYKVISGAYNIHLDYLKALAEKYENVQILQNVTNMSEVMASCDIAITAGGSTMYELSAVGVPILCFSFVENQEGIVKTFRERELVDFGGNFLENGESMLRELVEKLGELAEDVTARRSYSERQRQVVDGCGAMRIAKALARVASGN